ncbi:MAG TPA: hypothetical protein VKH42_02030 [Vicinamibacterales bacterium]|nr:hypothetical protein [Vicinamibacterales bacterium]
MTSRVFRTVPPSGAATGAAIVTSFLRRLPPSCDTTFTISNCRMMPRSRGSKIVVEIF